MTNSITIERNTYRILDLDTNMYYAIDGVDVFSEKDADSIMHMLHTQGVKSTLIKL